MYCLFAFVRHTYIISCKDQIIEGIVSRMGDNLPSQKFEVCMLSLFAKPTSQCLKIVS